MTVNDIKNFLNLIDEIRGFENISDIISFVQSKPFIIYYSRVAKKDFDVSSIKGNNDAQILKSEVIFELSRIIDSSSDIQAIKRILELVEEADKMIELQSTRCAFVVKAYSEFSNEIMFGENIKQIVTDQFSYQSYATKEVVEGIKSLLLRYANTILKEKDVSVGKSLNGISVNPVFNVSANSSNSTTNKNINSNEVSIETAFNDARNNVTLADISDKDRDAIIKRIDELENIYKNVNGPNRRFEKAKKIGTWALKMGIEAAVTLLPLILKMTGTV